MPIRPAFAATLLSAMLLGNACSGAPTAVDAGGVDASVTDSGLPDAGGGLPDAHVADAAVDGGFDAGLDAGPPLAPTHFIALPSLPSPRVFHTATRLQNGSVLIVGGETDISIPTAEVELFEPTTRTFRSLTPLPAARSHHIASLLPDGRVLIASGGKSSGGGRSYPCDDVTASALIYDPSTGVSTPIAPMQQARSFAESIELPNGSTLVVGGGVGTYDGGGFPVLADATTSAELFVPDAGWRTVGPMAARRYFHSLNLLPGGGVLVVGGAWESNDSWATSEKFDPTSETFVSAPFPSGESRFRHSTATLTDGRVLLVGGKEANIKFLRRAALYNPQTNAWSAVPAISTGGNAGTLTALPNGDALFIGGFFPPTTFAEALMFRAATSTWSPIMPLNEARKAHTATLLNDGSVLVVGGLDENDGVIGSAELAVP